MPINTGAGSGYRGITFQFNTDDRAREFANDVSAAKLIFPDDLVKAEIWNPERRVSPNPFPRPGRWVF